MTQKQIHKQAPSRKEETPVAEQPQKDPEAEALKNRTDDLLDEIDSILEDNAEEFVKEYIQKGGQ